MELAVLKHECQLKCWIHWTDGVSWSVDVSTKPAGFLIQGLMVSRLCIGYYTYLYACGHEVIYLRQLEEYLPGVNQP